MNACHNPLTIPLTPAMFKDVLKCVFIGILSHSLARNSNRGSIPRGVAKTSKRQICLIKRGQLKSKSPRQPKSELTPSGKPAPESPSPTNGPRPDLPLTFQSARTATLRVAPPVPLTFKSASHPTHKPDPPSLNTSRPSTISSASTGLSTSFPQTNSKPRRSNQSISFFCSFYQGKPRPTKPLGRKTSTASTSSPSPPPPPA